MTTKDSYKQARGVLPLAEGDERPEDTIRRLRHGIDEVSSSAVNDASSGTTLPWSLWRYVFRDGETILEPIPLEPCEVTVDTSLIGLGPSQEVIASLERSLKENAEIWRALAADIHEIKEALCRKPAA